MIGPTEDRVVLLLGKRVEDVDELVMDKFYCSYNGYSTTCAIDRMSLSIAN